MACMFWHILILTHRAAAKHEGTVIKHQGRKQGKEGVKSIVHSASLAFENKIADSVPVMRQ